MSDGHCNLQKSVSVARVVSAVRAGAQHVLLREGTWYLGPNQLGGNGGAMEQHFGRLSYPGRVPPATTYGRTLGDQ